ncbi:MAG: 2Fe-2S iron-sulfur cluster-binding protein [Kiritimatiellae bacterium]|nr:2Fe-2S iron-sulfur cluster-binding protein [Kiritimatiellia bacterium]MDD5523162.1 2Fe-2S iron-sulfur cluster-binding protein [Kiritimatiellia bacterium]
MSDNITFTIDGVEVKARHGETIIEAADRAGIYIPRLCYMKDLIPHGSCRVCTVMVNGRPQAACTQPVVQGIVVENNTPAMQKHRRNLIDMLFVEGNHFCMFCEKSGNCELQAMAYRFGIPAPKYPYMFPDKDIDASHPDIFIDRNRCILCGRCVSASRDVDGKTAFEFAGRGPHKKIAVNAEANLGDTNAEASDKAMSVCPVGALMKKRIGFAVPIGSRKYDTKPIGSEIESSTRK